MRRLLFYILFILTHVLLAQTNTWNQQVQSAKAFEQMGDYEKANAIYKSLLNDQPGNEIILQSLNKIYMQTKNYSASVDLLEDQVTIKPDNFVTYGLLGSTYYAMDNIEKAIETWDKGVAVNPASPTTYRTIANFMIENRLIEEATALLLRGREKLKKPDLYAFDLANMYTSMMKFKEAATEYCSILLNQNNQLDGIISRMNNYLFRSDALEITLKVVTDFCNDYPTPDLFQLAGFLFESKGDLDQAFYYVTKSHELSNDNGTILFNFANRAYEQSQFDIAAKTFDWLITNSPNTDYFAMAKIGYVRSLQMKLNKGHLINSDAWKPIRVVSPKKSPEYQRIIDLYNDIIQSFGDPEIRSESFFNIGMILKNQYQNFNDADSLFHIIITHYRSTRYALNAFLELSKIALMLNEPTKAETFLSMASQVKLDFPDINSEIKFYYAKLQFWLNRFDKTAALLAQFSGDLSGKHANDAIELSLIINTFKNDSTALAHYSKADLLIEQNRLKEAADFLMKLSESQDGTILSELAEFKLAQILIAQNELPLGAAMLENLAEPDNSILLGDKALYLLAQVYQFGIKDKIKAINFYEKLLATFPNSLYLGKAREKIKFLQPNY